MNTKKQTAIEIALTGSFNIPERDILHKYFNIKVKKVRTGKVLTNMYNIVNKNPKNIFIQHNINVNEVNLYLT